MVQNIDAQSALFKLSAWKENHKAYAIACGDGPILGDSRSLFYKVWQGIRFANQQLRPATRQVKQEDQRMYRNSLVGRRASLAAIGLVLAMGEARGETPFAISLCVSGPATSVITSPELTVIGVELNGITVSTSADKALDGLFYHFVGVSRTLSGKIDAHGYGKLTDIDGDSIFTQTTAIGPLSKPDWKSTFTQGTGKWKGISGQAEVSLITKRPPLADGKYRGCYLMQGSFNVSR